MKNDRRPEDTRGLRRYKKLCLGLLLGTVILSIILYMVSHKDAPAIVFAFPFLYLTMTMYSFIPIWAIHIRSETDHTHDHKQRFALPVEFMWRYGLFYAVIGLLAGIPIYILGVKHYLIPSHKLMYIFIVAFLALLGSLHGRKAARR